MSTSDEVTAVTPENIAKFRQILADRSDGALEIEARNTASAVGVAAAELLFERRERLASTRHKDLLEAIKTPHWSQTPGFGIGVIGVLAGVLAAVFAYLSYVQQLQPSAQGLPSAQTSASGVQTPASSSQPRTQPSAPQPQGPRK